MVTKASCKGVGTGYEGYLRIRLRYRVTLFVEKSIELHVFSGAEAKLGQEFLSAPA